MLAKRHLPRYPYLSLMSLWSFERTGHMKFSAVPCQFCMLVPTGFEELWDWLGGEMLLFIETMMMESIWWRWWWWWWWWTPSLAGCCQGGCQGECQGAVHCCSRSSGSTLGGPVSGGGPHSPEIVSGIQGNVVLRTIEVQSSVKCSVKVVVVLLPTVNVMDAQNLTKWGWCICVDIKIIMTLFVLVQLTGIRKVVRSTSIALIHLAKVQPSPPETASRVRIVNSFKNTLVAHGAHG